MAGVAITQTRSRVIARLFAFNWRGVGEIAEVALCPFWNHAHDDFGILTWVHPSFWRKSDFLLFIMDEYQATFCRS
jgi:hypothetical protein